MSLHTQFDFAFYGTIKTREQVQAFLHFRIKPNLSDSLGYLLGFKSTERLYNELGPELHAKAQAATCRWALQFSSADAALDPAAYTSLQTSLRAIASTLFTIVSISVSNIVPVTPKIDPPKPKIEPLPPPSIEDQMRAEIMPIIGKVKAIHTIESEIKATKPELADSPRYGFASGTIPNPTNTNQLIPVQGLLKRKFDHMKGEILK